MIKLTDVFKSVDRTLTASFDNIKVHKERINKLTRPSMTVELITFSTSNQSRFIINKSIDLDIIYFSKGNSVGEALIVADKLMGAFSLGLPVRAYGKDGVMVDKRHLHCLKPPEYKLVDQDLHFLVRFDFADELEAYNLADDKEMKPYKPKMEEGLIDRRLPKDPDNPNSIENKPFVEDVKFIKEEDKKKYEEEAIKLMQSIKLEYEILEV